MLTVALLAGVARAAAGDLDPSFGVGGKVLTDFDAPYDAAFAVALQPDGKIIAAGGTGTFDANEDFALARYNADGSLDASFGSGGKVLTDLGAADHARGVALQADGKIVAAGISDAGPNSDFALARYNADGSLDASFGVGGKVLTDIGALDEALALALQPDGKIVAAGDSWSGDNIDFALARYNADGSLDPSFGSGGKVLTDFEPGFELAWDVAIQPDGKIVAAGASGNEDFALVRYNADGSLDPSFGSGGKVLTDLGSSDEARGVVLEPGGKIIAAGRTFHSGPNFDFALVRYDADGSLDPSFGAEGKVLTDFGSNDQAFGVALQPDGRTVAAGFSTAGGSFDLALVRYKPDGSLDASFGVGGKVLTDIRGPSSDVAFAVVLQPQDAKIVAAGQSNAAGNPDFALVRYLGDSVAPPTAADLTVNKVDERDPVVVGTKFKYVIFLGNNGPEAAEAVVVTDRLPKSVAFVRASSTRGSCTASGRLVTCTVGRLGAGRSATVEITVRATEVGIIRNRATVSAGTFDPDTSNNSDSARTTVVAG